MLQTTEDGSCKLLSFSDEHMERLYAKTEDEVFPEGEPFVIGGNRIGVRTPDLNTSFETIKAQLDNIVLVYFKNAKPSKKSLDQANKLITNKRP